MVIELKFKGDRARMTAFYLAKKFGKRKPDLQDERKLSRFLARSINLLVAEAVDEEARKDLRINHGLNV